MGIIAKIDAVDLADLVKWVASIPLPDWPQQHPVDGQLRPAMVTDLSWHGFGLVVTPLVTKLTPVNAEAYQFMLSCVMPGHSIPVHKDEQDADWLYRVHVPLLTNSDATFNGMHMQVGWAYDVDTRKPHEVHNKGRSPRVHFMFDLRRRR